MPRPHLHQAPSLPGAASPTPAGTACGSRAVSTPSPRLARPPLLERRRPRPRGLRDAHRVGALVLLTESLTLRKRSLGHSAPSSTVLRVSPRSPATRACAPPPPPRPSSPPAAPAPLRLLGPQTPLEPRSPHSRRQTGAAAPAGRRRPACPQPGLPSHGLAATAPGGHGGLGAGGRVRASTAPYLPRAGPGLCRPSLCICLKRGVISLLPHGTPSPNLTRYGCRPQPSRADRGPRGRLCAPRVPGRLLQRRPRSRCGPPLG